MENLFAIIIGVLSSFISSIIFLFTLSRLRPRIDISKMISKDIDSNGKPIYRIKVINRNKRPIINIKAQLTLVKPWMSPGGAIIKSTDIKLKRSDPIEIAKYDRNDKEASFAYRFLTYEDIDNLWGDDKQRYLRFRIFASDSLSGLGKVFKQNYHIKRSAIVDGDFEFGDSLNVK